MLSAHIASTRACWQGGVICLTLSRVWTVSQYLSVPQVHDRMLCRWAECAKMCQTLASVRCRSFA